MLATSTNGKRLIGRPFRTVRDAFVGNAKCVVPEADSKGRIGDWIGCAADVSQWERTEKNGGLRERG